MEPWAWLWMTLALAAVGSSGRETARPMRPYPTDIPFVAGPLVGDGQTLVGWLRQQAAADRASPKKRLIRMPVVVVQRDGSWRPQEALIAASGAPPPPDAVRIALDDTTLGVSLDDRIRGFCPQARGWCALWVEGHLGSVRDQLLGIASPGAARQAAASNGPLPLTVRWVHRAVSAEEARDPKLRILVEASTPASRR